MAQHHDHQDHHDKVWPNTFVYASFMVVLRVEVLAIFGLFNFDHQPIAYTGNYIFFQRYRVVLLL